MTPASVNPAETAVLVAAHGSARAPETAESALAHAARLRARGAFAEVRVGFLKQPPFLADALAAIAAPRVVIAPFMAADGYVTSHLMPEALDAPGDAPGRSPRVSFAEAAGSHPLVARACAKNIGALMQSGAAHALDAHVMVIGHGTGRNPANERAARRFTAALAQMLPPDVSFETVFLERAPRLADRAARTPRLVTFAVPFLMAGGYHLTTDVPEGLGLARAAPPVDAPFAGPFTAQDQIRGQTRGQTRGQPQGQSVFLMRAVGFEPVMTDALEARVMAALAHASAAA